MSDYINHDMPMITEACEAVAILNDQYMDTTEDDSRLPFKFEYWGYQMAISFMDDIIWDSENDGVIYQYSTDGEGVEIESIIPLMNFLLPKVKGIMDTIKRFKP